MAEPISRPQEPRPEPTEEPIITHGSPNDGDSRPKK